MPALESGCETEEILNYYEYDFNDPINNYDPSGLLPEKVVNYLSSVSAGSTDAHLKALAGQALTLEGQINAHYSAGASANAAALFQQQVDILKQISVSGSQNAWEWAQVVATEPPAASTPVEPPEGTIREHGPLLVQYRNHQWVTYDNRGKDAELMMKMYAKEYALNAAGLAIGEGIGFVGGRILEGLGLGADAANESVLVTREAATLSGDAADRALHANPVSWVEETTGMSSRAEQYGAGATGARTDLISGNRQVPQLGYKRVDGSLQMVRFDGYEEGVLIDRKLAVVDSPRGYEEATRQSTALLEHGLKGRWEVANAKEAAIAQKMFNNIGIINITIKVVPP